MSDETSPVQQDQSGLSDEESTALLATVEGSIKAEMVRLREKLDAVEGNPARLSSSDRTAYTSMAAVVHAIEHLRYVRRVGAVDDVPTAVADLKRELRRSVASLSGTLGDSSQES